MIENNVTSFLPVHWSHFTVAIFIFNSFFTFLPFFDAQNSFFILYCEKKCLMSWDDLIKWMEKGSLRLKTKMQFSIFLQDQKKMFTSLKRFDIAWKYVKIFLISRDCWTYFVYNGSKYTASPFSTKMKTWTLKTDKTAVFACNSRKYVSVCKWECVSNLLWFISYSL